MAERTVSKWEKIGRETTPWPENQAILDTALVRASEDAQARFSDLLLAASAEHTSAMTAKSNKVVNAVDVVSWPSDGASARAAAVALWSEDRDDASPVGNGLQTASLNAVLKWLLARRADDIEGLAPRSAIQQVTTDDVAALVAMTRSLRALDGEHGGGAALPLVLEYLKHEVVPLLHGRYREPTGRALFAAAAELAMLAGVDGL